MNAPHNAPSSLHSFNHRPNPQTKQTNPFPKWPPTLGFTPRLPRLYPSKNTNWKLQNRWDAMRSPLQSSIISPLPELSFRKTETYFFAQLFKKQQLRNRKNLMRLEQSWKDWILDSYCQWGNILNDFLSASKSVFCKYFKIHLKVIGLEFLAFLFYSRVKSWSRGSKFCLQNLFAKTSFPDYFVISSMKERMWKVNSILF